MFKFETVVKSATLLSVTLLFFSHSLAADGDRDRGDRYRSRDRADASGQHACMDRWQEEIIRLTQLKRTTQTKEGKAEVQVDINDAQKKAKECVDLVSNDDNDCKSAVRDFKRAKEDAIKSCGAFQGSSATGNIGCAHAIERCDCLDTPPAQMGDRKNFCEGASGASIEARLQACPAEAAKDLKDDKNEARELRKSVRDLQQQINREGKSDKKENKQDLKGARDKMKQVRDQRAQETEKLYDKLKEANQKQQQARGEIQKQIFDLKDELNKITGKENQIAKERREAEAKHRDTETAMRISCHKKGIDEVNELIKIETAKVVANIRNFGGFNALMKQVNRTDRQQWKEVARNRYNECMRDLPTRDTIKASLRTLMNTNKALDAEERKLLEERKNIEARMDRLRNGNYCSNGNATTANGDTRDSAMCEANFNALMDQMTARNVYGMKIANLAQDKADARQEMFEAAMERDGMMSKDNIAPMMEDLATEKQRLNELENLIRIKESMAGGRKMDQRQFDEARSKNADMRSKALNLADCQTRERERAGQSPNCGSECKQAVELLYSIGTISDSERSYYLRSAQPSTTPTNGSEQNRTSPAEATPEQEAPAP